MRRNSAAAGTCAQGAYGDAAMDAFESLIATHLRREGYWVESSVKREE